jgi:Holliday junction resolvase-like predicted endonuclease
MALSGHKNRVGECLPYERKADIDDADLNQNPKGAPIAVSSSSYRFGGYDGIALVQTAKIVVEVKGGEILVTMPGTSLSVVYEKTEDNQLLANSFSARKDENRKLSLPKFLALAWTAANEKAKQIGWIE